MEKLHNWEQFNESLKKPEPPKDRVLREDGKDLVPPKKLKKVSKKKNKKKPEPPKDRVFREDGKGLVPPKK